MFGRVFAADTNKRAARGVYSFKSPNRKIWNRGIVSFSLTKHLVYWLYWANWLTNYILGLRVLSMMSAIWFKFDENVANCPNMST